MAPSKRPYLAALCGALALAAALFVAAGYALKRDLKSRT